MNVKGAFKQHLKDEAATVSIGNRLAKSITQGAVLFLHGELGAGKTTLSRGIVQGFGHTGKVKSPTYTLVEPYELETQSIYHFDLYRLADPEELEFMGIRDYFTAESICLIEWPERGYGAIPEPDLEIQMQYDENQRIITLTAHTVRGKKIISNLE